MQRFTALLATLVAALSITFAPAAQAATAYLLRCDMGMSVTGRTVYTGLYNYAGTQFTRTFASYCPYSVEVY